MTDRRHLVQPLIPTPASLARRIVWALATLAIIVAVCWLTAAAI